VTPAEKLVWAATVLATLAKSEFYGEVTFQFAKGDLAISRLNQTVKPEPKAFREMTAVEYKMHQDLEKLLVSLTGGKHG
jgi:hypothetical protein